MFRGREITHPELANALMDRLKEMIVDNAEIEQHPKLEGRNMTMVLGPK
jgi:translation initiation factor IF-3